MKQDRVHPRTAAQIQRKYGKKVATTATVAEDAAKEATQASASAESAAKAAAAATQDLSGLKAELALTIKVNENGEVVSEINGVAQVIKFLANCISIQSDNFTLAEDGTVAVKGINIDGGSIVLAMKNEDGEITGYVKIGEKYAQLSVDSEDYAFGSGCSLGFLPNAICFSAGGAASTTLPIQFSYENGAYRCGLVGDWYIKHGTVHLADKIDELEARIKALEGS